MHTVRRPTIVHIALYVEQLKDIKEEVTVVIKGEEEI